MRFLISVTMVVSAGGSKWRNFSEMTRDRGLDFKSDPDFQNARVGISHWDNYQIYITGYFLTRVDGAYEFRTDRADDRATLWSILIKMVLR